MPTKSKILTAPEIIKRMADVRPIEDFPLRHYSYSAFVSFSTNPFMFKMKYLNGEQIPTPAGISSVLGNAFHNAMEAYWSVNVEFDPIAEGLAVGMKFLEEYPDAFVEYNTDVPNKQRAQEVLAFGFNAYVSERPRTEKSVTLGCELRLEHEIDCQWKGQRIVFPVKLLAYIDRLIERDKGISPVDYKFVKAFSDPDKIDAKKILQAITYYFVVYMETGKPPYSCIFQEVKRTKNSKDNIGKPQVQEYEIVYADNDLFFDFFFRFYDDITRAINGEMVYVPNIETFYDNEIGIIAYIHRLDVTEEAARQMQELRVTTITDLLKSKIENAGNMRKLMATAEKSLTSAALPNYEAMTTAEKIQTKLLEHGMIIKFQDKIEGYSVDLYRYSPSIGLKMKKLEGYSQDIEQVTGKSGVRILAPIPNSSFIGFEVPKENRTFPTSTPRQDGFNLAIGADVYGKTFHFDITKAPHMLVAGATGSGKSVFLNSIIKQISNIPNTKLHLFDPKIVELAQFRFLPNVDQYYTEAEDIYLALDGLVYMMNERYKVMASKGVRSIDEQPDLFPRNFVVIDEYGDLAVGNKPNGRLKKGEINISGSISDLVLILAQKARAAGIHLIVATQRPSVDIITGSIKANFPTKVAFRTAKATDSLVLLDSAGAEKLLGRGDMLFNSDEGQIRLQGFNL